MRHFEQRPRDRDTALNTSKARQTCSLMGEENRCRVGPNTLIFNRYATEDTAVALQEPKSCPGAYKYHDHLFSGTAFLGTSVSREEVGPVSGPTSHPPIKTTPI